MFCRRLGTLPPDPTFPVNFEKLGYFITREDLIRNIEHPDDRFRFYITNNERYNEVHCEAFHECIRREVYRRLLDLGLSPLYLPSLSITKPAKDTPHMAILSTPPQLLKQKRRVFVIMNHLLEDLGIFSYRVLSHDGGIDKGSAVCFVRELLARFSGTPSGTHVLCEESNTTIGKLAEPDDPGIIILNPGQLLYSYRHGKSMTPTSWNAKPRKSAVHPIPLALPENHVPGNSTVEEHLSFVFDNILGNKAFVAEDAELFLVGLGDGGNELVTYLEKNWSKQSGRLNIAALALTAPLPILPSTAHISLTNEAFLTFLAARARAWKLSAEPLNTHIANATSFPIRHEMVESAPSSGEGSDATDEDFIHLCSSVSGGEELYAECVVTTAYEKIAEWFAEVAGAL